ncbi:MULTISPECIES: hypothetical protein [Enterobacterales]|uniref:hypothetical protein n=1 Tax=Enterobacterales TaxID=91347 RepID=UPI002EDB9CC1
MSDVTKGKPAKKLKIINQCKINDFRAMMEEALAAMDRVLAQRTKDLEVWGEKEQTEFYRIFGSKGDRIIEVEMSLRGDGHKVKMTAREVMQNCIRRLKWIKGQMTLDDYINEIYDPDNPDDPTNSAIRPKSGMPKTFSAYVNEQKQDDYKVHIGINFTGRVEGGNTRVCATVMGSDSRVTTLCHEMSHFVKIFADPEHGGMGTSDYDVKGRKPASGQKDKDTILQHQSGANDMVIRNDYNVFDNAYNIEKYFEITL